jgi:hypothetical protein
MSPLPFVDVMGAWLGIFLTMCILSFLYKDNPFYKIAEHLFVGVSIGYIVIKQYYDNIRPNLIDHLGRWELWYLVPLVLVLMLFTRSVSRRFAWVGRYPLAIVVALYAGTQVNGLAESDLAQQIKISAQPIDVRKLDLNQPVVDDAWRADLGRLVSPPIARRVETARQQGRVFGSVDEIAALPGLSEMQARDLANADLEAGAAIRPGEIDWFSTISRLLLLLGLCASLVYFYYSLEQTGVVGRVSKLGAGVLMIGFGASFGLTVQGRLSLAIGRAIFLLGRDRNPVHAEQVQAPTAALVSVVLIVVGLVVWERWWLRRPAKAAAAPGDDDEPPAY